MSRRVWLVVLLGLSLRLALAWQAREQQPVKDALEYHQLASRLARGEGYVDSGGEPTAFRAPGYPVLLALAYRGLGSRPFAGYLLQALLGTLLVVGCERLARSAAGAGAGLVAALLAAVYPPFLTSYYGVGSLLSEPLASACLTLGLASAAASPGRAGALLAGLWLGLGGLARTALLPLALLAALWRGWRTRVAQAVVLLLAVVCVVAPWTLRNRLALGHWVAVSTNGGISLWTSYNPLSRGLGNAEYGYAAAWRQDREWRREGVDEVERSRRFRRRALESIGSEPGRALWLVARKALLFLDPTWPGRDGLPPRANLAYLALLPWALLGLRRWREPVPLLLALSCVAYATLHVLVHVAVRYRVVIEPALVVFASLGLCWLGDRLGRRWLLWLLTVQVLLLAALGWGYGRVFGLLSGLVRAVGL